MTNLFSLELEQSVLGCVLLDPKDCLHKLMESLKPDDFYTDANKLIYETIIKLTKENKEIDAVILYQSNKDISPSYISALMDGQLSVRNIEAYCKELKQLSIRRQAINRINTFQDAVRDGEDIDIEIDRFIQDMIDIKKDTSGGVVKVGEIIMEVYNRINDGYNDGVFMGYKEINEFLKGFHKGEVIVVGADTSVGKTSFALNITERMANAGNNILFFSLEMGRHRITQNLLTITAGIETRSSLEKLESDKHWLGQEKIDNIKKLRLSGAKVLSDMGIYLDDRNHNITTMSAVARNIKSKVTKADKSLDLIIIDYLQLIESDERVVNREQQVAKISAGIKRLAKEVNIPILVLSQVNDDARKDKRKYRATDLRESKRIAQDADVVMFLCRDDKDLMKYILDTVKQRNGPLFSSPLSFTPEIITFKDGNEN